jgi:hypothetical protein
MLMPNRTDQLSQFHKKLQPLVKEEFENKYVQQPREMEKYEEDLESGEKTLPLCFSSFKLLKQDVNKVLYLKSSRYDVEYPKYSGIAEKNHLPLCFSSF